MKPRTLIPQMPSMPAVRHFDNYDEWFEGGERLAKFGELLKRTGAQYQIVVGEWYKDGLAKEAKWRKDTLASKTHRAISVERAAQELGFDRETIANWGWVASNTTELRAALNGSGDPSSISGLTFEDLRAVAALPSPKEQRRWIDDKRANDWSATELRRQIAQARGKPVSPRNDAERQAARDDSAAGLIDRWIGDGNRLLDEARCDEADLCFDHADKLKRALTLRV